MAKTLHIQDLFCFEDIRFDIEPGVTWISGPNSSGKSSCAVTLAAMTAHEGNPMRLSATQKKQYVRDGKMDGVATLGDVLWKPPGGVEDANGAEPDATPHAVGLINFITGARSTKERAVVWEGLFLPSDVRSILEPVWTRPKTQLELVIDTIEKQGWEAALKIYEGHRAEAKQRWGKITGQTYGKKVAASWVPQLGWSADLEGQSEEQLTAVLTDARDDLSRIMAQSSIQQDQIDRARRVKDEYLPKARDKLKTWEAEMEKRGEIRREAKEAYDAALKSVTEVENKIKSARTRYEELLAAQTPQFECPQCKVGLTMQGGQLSVWAAPENPVSESQWQEVEAKYGAEIDRRRKLAHAAHSQLEEATAEYGKARDMIAMTDGEINTLNRQAADAEKTATAEVDEADIAKHQNIISERESQLRAWSLWSRASAEHENVVEADLVCKLLGPTGARASLMREAMDAINKLLSAISGITGWAPIKLHDDYGISSGGRAVRMTASNERLKAQWCMQIAAMQLPQKKSQWCILDNADTLKGESWEGLTKLAERLVAKHPNLHLVICGTGIDMPGAVKINAQHQIEAQ